MRKFMWGLLALILTAGISLAANNILIQQPNGQFAIIKSIDDGTGVQTLSTTSTGSANAASGITPLSALAATSLVVKATPGNFYDGYAVNRTATTGFIILYNATAAPAPGALTAGLVLGCSPLPASGSGSLAVNGSPPSVLSLGIVILISSAANCGTYTTGVITADVFGRAL